MRLTTRDSSEPELSVQFHVLLFNSLHSPAACLMGGKTGVKGDEVT